MPAQAQAPDAPRVEPASRKGFLVSLASAAVDAAAAVALLCWAPLVRNADADAPLGAAYSLVLASAAAGAALFGSLVQDPLRAPRRAPARVF